MQFVSQLLASEEGPANEVQSHRARLSAPFFKLRCPLCGSDSAEMRYEQLAQEHHAIPCSRCLFVLLQEDGIWRGLAPDREKYYAQFVREYEEVRNAEGRGSERPAFYLALPYCDVTERNSWQWSIRSRTYRYIVRNILRELPRGENSSPAILDLGAGNGWLSYRLACLGHRPIAVDLIANLRDGLGAAVHYRASLPQFFPRVQAELDRLPFADGQFDCAIFNASFHYSEKYERTIAEAVRCLRPGGIIVIADSPTYASEESGRRMVRGATRVFQDEVWLQVRRDVEL